MSEGDKPELRLHAEVHLPECLIAGFREEPVMAQLLQVAKVPFQRAAL
jgi:hypothetical protein